MRLEGSGTPTIAMPSGPSNPEISEEFTAAPEVVYSPIVLAKLPLPKKVRDEDAIRARSAGE